MNTIRSVFPLRELKFDAPSDGVSLRTFSGYGAAFGNIDAYGDVIMPGAFSEFLADAKSGKAPWPSMLSQHGGMALTSEDMTPIGVWQDLAEDGSGLRVTGQLADTPRGNEIDTLMRMTPRPAIDGLSIGYIPKRYEPRSKPEDPRRRLKRIDVVEISLVTFPANGNARVDSVKSERTIRDAERALRDAGFSTREAKAIVAEGFKSMPQRDGEDVEELAAILRRNVSIITP